MNVTITVIYTCRHCHALDVQLAVPARQDEDVLTWTRATVGRVYRDHRTRHPTCQAQTLDELKIPMTGADRVGGPTVQ